MSDCISLAGAAESPNVLRQLLLSVQDKRIDREEFNRPFGTLGICYAIPPLKGWAILKSPSGRGDLRTSSALEFGLLAAFVSRREIRE